MKELVRRLLKENLNTINIGLYETQDYLVLYDVKLNTIIGVVTYEKVSEGLYHVPAIAAEKGFGYVLYQIVMSIVSPSYIITDRDSSTTYAAIKTLKRLYDDPNIEHMTLKSDDVNYLNFKQENEEYNLLVNTKFKIKNKLFFSNMVSLGKNNKINLEKLNKDAFKFFSKKLNNY